MPSDRPKAFEPKRFSQQRVADCDLSLLLVAFRRGCVPPGETPGITQLETEMSRRFVCRGGRAAAGDP